ncbi:MAG: glycerate dehydrogenase, partial [Rhodocyclales bacterium]|nr:glycerate dehydrogenase [Rhodocyclales bacterium]
MTIHIVCLERNSTQAVLRKPECRHEWVEYPATAPAEIVARLQGAQVAIVNKLRLDAAVLEQLPDLRLIALLATGADNIDLQACEARQIVVSNVRGYAVHSVPEHAITLMLALRRRLFEYVADVHAGRWAQSPTFCLLDHPVRDLHGAVLGVVGRGALGEATARLGAAFGMKVLFAEHKGANLVRDGYTAFETVLREADVLSLHCPLNEHTHRLIGADELALMKRGAILINTARGALVDEAALAQALRSGG